MIGYDQIWLDRIGKNRCIQDQIKWRRFRGIELDRMSRVGLDRIIYDWAGSGRIGLDRMGRVDISRVRYDGQGLEGQNWIEWVEYKWTGLDVL